MTDANPFPYQPLEIDLDLRLVPERATAGAFLLSEGRVLLEKRPDDGRVYANCWDTPGGHLEKGETPESALQRELREELGIEVERCVLGLVQDDRDRSSGTFYRHFVYLVRSYKGKVESREGRTLRWFPLAEALALRDLNPLIGYAMHEFMTRGWLGDG